METGFKDPMTGMVICAMAANVAMFAYGSWWLGLLQMQSYSWGYPPKL